VFVVDSLILSATPTPPYRSISSVVTLSDHKSWDPVAEFGPTAYYSHLALLSAACPYTNVLSGFATLSFFFYASRPPVGRSVFPATRPAPLV